MVLRRSLRASLAAGFILAAAQGCAMFGDDGPGRHGRRGPDERAARAISPDETLARYDANKDGAVTRAELDQVLETDFRALDTDADGKLSKAEAWAESERRWKESGTQSTPLLDWSRDGFVDFAEFANMARATFVRLDRNEDGTVDADEMRPRRRPTQGEGRPHPERGGGDRPNGR